MYSVNFTPGPWTYNVNGLKITIGDESTRHAHLAHDYTVAVIEGNSPTDKANAQLIAVAPDLLKSLETSVKVWEDAETHKPLGKSRSGFPPIWITDARKAIAKAKGMDDGLST